MNTANLQKKEKTAQLLWTGLILSFFAIQAVLWTVAISVTARDSSHAVVSGYDEQALNWDEVQRQRRASETLGWESEVSVAPTGDIRGNREVTICLKDSSDVPIENAEVTATVIHRGRASEVQQISFEQIGGGVFQGAVKIQNSGKWRFSGTATVGDDHFIFEEQLEIDSNRNL